mmetsp:Transcript_34021/g.105033  ORF Transcript_34021/g.105033 Transcript_34021/m.105033 type:complete len:232 (-) Transcript_34021:73-768(-)
MRQWKRSSSLRSFSKRMYSISVVGDCVFDESSSMICSRDLDMRFHTSRESVNPPIDLRYSASASFDVSAAGARLLASRIFDASRFDGTSASAFFFFGATVSACASASEPGTSHGRRPEVPGGCSPPGFMKPMISCSFSATVFQPGKVRSGSTLASGSSRACRSRFALSISCSVMVLETKSDSGSIGCCGLADAPSAGAGFALDDGPDVEHPAADAAGLKAAKSGAQAAACK